MEVKLTVFLYSKYSEPSKKLISIAENIPLQAKQIFKPVFLSVDSERIRKNISNKIKLVPCIIISYTNNQLEKFEGEAAFEWLQDIINRTSAPLPKKNDDHKEEIQSDDTIKRLEEKLKIMEEKLNQKESLNVNKPVQQRTMIGTGKSTEVIVDNNEDEFIDDIDLKPQQDQKTAVQVKQESLHNLAAELQKDRELMDEQLKARRVIV